MIIRVSRTRTYSIKQAHNKVQPNSKRDKEAKHSLSRPMIYTYFSPFSNKLPKSLKMVLCISQAWSSGGGVERTPSTKAFGDVLGDDGGGVGAGGGTGAVATGANDVSLESGTSTPADL